MIRMEAGWTEVTQNFVMHLEKCRIWRNHLFTSGVSCLRFSHHCLPQTANTLGGKNHRWGCYHCSQQANLPSILISWFSQEKNKYFSMQSCRNTCFSVFFMIHFLFSCLPSVEVLWEEEASYVHCSLLAPWHYVQAWSKHSMNGEWVKIPQI